MNSSLCGGASTPRVYEFSRPLSGGVWGDGETDSEGYLVGARGTVSVSWV